MIITGRTGFDFLDHLSGWLDYRLSIDVDGVRSYAAYGGWPGCGGVRG